MAQHTTTTASGLKYDQKREKYFSKRRRREERLFPLPLLGTSSAAWPDGPGGQLKRRAARRDQFHEQSERNETQTHEG
jgi:hypothetical protein